MEIIKWVFYIENDAIISTFWLDISYLSFNLLYAFLRKRKESLFVIFIYHNFIREKKVFRPYIKYFIGIQISSFYIRHFLENLSLGCMVKLIIELFFCFCLIHFNWNLYISIYYIVDKLILICLLCIYKPKGLT